MIWLLIWLLTNKQNSVVTELFIGSRKLSISLVFITQSYFKGPKNVRLTSMHFFIMNIPNKRELQQIALNHSSDIIFKDFIKIYEEYTAAPYSFLVSDATLASDNPLRIRKNLFNMIRLEMKNYYTILTEKLPKYLLCHQTNLISMNILQAKKYYHLIKNKWYSKLSLLILLLVKLLKNK